MAFLNATNATDEGNDDAMTSLGGLGEMDDFQSSMHHGTNATKRIIQC